VETNHIKKIIEQINAVGVTGKVEVKFKIEEDGSSTTFDVLKAFLPKPMLKS
jgi:outer membrane biosynthesis protein TonB